LRNEDLWRALNDAFDLALEEGCIARNPMASVNQEKLAPINRS
jgi:hypothetical protein